MNTFTFEGHTFNYFDYPHNNTKINERAVELPLVKYFLDRFPDCVEIGAVSPYYFEGTHEIYDLTDSHVRSKKVNAKDIAINGRNLLSISTLEHCGVRDFFSSVEDLELAPHLLYRWVEESDNYLITWPFGYCDWLDKYAVEKFNPKFISRRPQNSHNWEQIYDYDKLDDHDKKYGGFHCASTILVILNVF